MEWRWKEFWDAIVINAIDNNYWKSIFRDAFETGFNRGFAYANDKPYSDAVFEHRNLSQDSANCDNYIVDDRNMLRLKIAAQLESAMIINDQLWCQYGHYGMEKDFAKLAMRFADALIAESEKGGAK